jgi:hypothetical protein
MNREYTRFPVQFLRNSTRILQETVFVHKAVCAFFCLLVMLRQESNFMFFMQSSKGI